MIVKRFFPITMSLSHKICILLFWIIGPGVVYAVGNKIVSGVPIKVLLEEQRVATAAEWMLACDKGFVLSDPSDPSKKLKTTASTVRITSDGESLILNAKKMKKHHCVISPAEGTCTFQGKPYKGDFIFALHNKKLLCMNRLDLEEYIACVLATESWPGWPLEINKTLAIACRSYAVATMIEARKNKLPYHIKNSNVHQTYKGAHNNQRLYDAVDQTAGLLLMHNNKPALAMFDICCGGVVPAKMQDFDFRKAPYLARQSVCGYCKKSSFVYNWKAQYELNHLHTQCASVLPAGTVLKDVHITKKDKAGKVHEIALKSTKKTVVLSMRQLYSLCKDKIKSFCFTVKRKGNTVLFEGKGYGHHLGLCQWGARHMVDDGWDHVSILKFYYPGTSLARIS